MQNVLITCDRCYREARSDSGNLAVGWSHAKAAFRATPPYADQFELCDDCTRDLQTWWDNKQFKERRAQ